MPQQVLSVLKQMNVIDRAKHADATPLAETITLQKAKKLIQCMAHEQSFLLLSPPGIGKSERRA